MTEYQESAGSNNLPEDLVEPELLYDSILSLPGDSQNQLTYKPVQLDAAWADAQLVDTPG